MNFLDEDEWSNNASVYGQMNQTDLDVKVPVFAEIELQSTDVDAFNILFESNDDEEIGSANENDPFGDIQQTENHEEINENHDETAIVPVEQNQNASNVSTATAKQVVKLDDDIEYAFNSNDDFRPYIENEYLVKSNDVLCGNRPFKPNATGDRAFQIEIRGGFKEISLSARAVNGLIILNGINHNKKSSDKRFLKALAIGLCTIKRIKEDAGIIDEGIINFMKGLSYKCILYQVFPIQR